MKKSCLIFVLIAAIASCNSNEPDKNKTTPADTIASAAKTDTASAKTDSHYFWTSELDQKNGLVMKKTSPISKDSLTAENMIQMMNNLYPEIQLNFIRVSNDSIFVKINKSDYLTEQSGSSGAESYLAEVTYNLTELNGINFVDIRFKQGDHASPGTYSRTDFVH